MQSNIAYLYEQSRKRSMVRQLVFYLAGEQDMMLNFQALCEHIHIEDQIDVGIQMIPVRAILGCVTLHDSFDADFNPRNDSVRSQWETIAGCVSTRIILNQSRFIRLDLITL